MNTLELRLAGAAGQGDPTGADRRTDPAIERLRAAVARGAQERDLLDVAYRTLDTPVGSLLLAATPVGLVRVAYAREDHDTVLAALAERVSPRILRAPARLDDAARQLDAYFAHQRHGFTIPLDLRLAHGFRRTVLEQLSDVAYGRTVSYAELAAGVGNPRAVRAVGTACATNPLPLLIPCHRVVRSDGTPGGYVGGPQAKRVLLDLEHAV
ncbi:MAG TPA: methylated-DNA--[protein]-cysteine S-methyltransferase [Micromonosporaceae bacterium]|nr:methylated-DNA--[protein]-cysteine S-methyltransferase [Micromonosporaceae bacterium]